MIYNSDDMFLLGNIAALAVVSDMGSGALRILNLLGLERPKNAGSYVLLALHFQSQGQTAQALRMLEESPAFECNENRDEALALHLVLLQADQQFDRALDLGHAYIAENIVKSENAHHTVRTVIEDIESALETGAPANTA